MKRCRSKTPGALALAATLLLLGACEKTERPAFALTSTGRLLGFDTAKPKKIKTEVRVTGLNSGESLVQIAYRSASNRYYGLTNQSRICTLDPETGAANLVSTTAFTSETLINPVMDFNPKADRLRIVANEQNLRVNPDDGTLVATDTDVFFDNDDENDDSDPLLAAVAYDQNESNAENTTLFALDVTTQSVVRIGSKNGSPTSPDSGRLFTEAKLRTSFSSNAVGFDIEPNGDTAYAALAASGAGAALYRIDLDDGSADFVDDIDDGDRTIISLAIGPKEPSSDP